MKKTFSLSLPGKDSQRLVESVKGEIRKYLKRERRKPLPAEVDFWDFDCRVGLNQATAENKHIEEVIDAVGEAAANNAAQVYVEILSKPGRRTKKPVVIRPELPNTEPDSSLSKDREGVEGTTASTPNHQAKQLTPHENPRLGVRSS
jgi:hypothetical protein